MAQFAPKITAISDCDITCFFFELCLSDKGYQVSYHPNLESYLKDSSWELPDLFILDNEQNAKILSDCKRLRRNPKRDLIPILVLTRFDDLCDSELYYQSGADDVITKPFSPDSLSIHVNNLLFPSPTSHTIIGNNVSFVEQSYLH